MGTKQVCPVDDIRCASIEKRMAAMKAVNRQGVLVAEASWCQLQNRIAARSFDKDTFQWQLVRTGIWAAVNGIASIVNRS